jgi:hypothetical protein
MNTKALTLSAMRRKASKGEYCGGEAPYGFANVDGMLVECPAEKAVVARIHEARARGLSHRAIVAELELAGIVGRTGSPLQKTQVTNILNAHSPTNQSAPANNF